MEQPQAGVVHPHEHHPAQHAPTPWPLRWWYGPHRTAAVVAAGTALVLVVVGGVAAVALSGRSAPAQAAGPTAAPSYSPTVTVSAAPGVAAPVGASEVAAMLPAGEDTLVLGDSLALTVYPWLADDLPDRYVDYEAEVGRSTAWAEQRLRTLLAAGRVPGVVIVSAGTNDGDAAAFGSTVTSVLDLLGPGRCVIWADVARPDRVGDSDTALDEALNAAARGRANVRVLGWKSLVGKHPDWIGGDGIHPTATGAEGRAQAFADSAYACSPLDTTAPRARKEYLPYSAFVGPISGIASGGSGQRPASPTATGRTPSGSASSTGSASPSEQPSPSASDTTPPPSPPPSTSTPPDPSTEPPTPSESVSATG